MKPTKENPLHGFTVAQIATAMLNTKPQPRPAKRKKTAKK